MTSSQRFQPHIARGWRHVAVRSTNAQASMETEVGAGRVRDRSRHRHTIKMQNSYTRQEQAVTPDAHLPISTYGHPQPLSVCTVNTNACSLPVLQSRSYACTCVRLGDDGLLLNPCMRAHKHTHTHTHTHTADQLTFACIHMYTHVQASLWARLAIPYILPSIS